MTYAEMIQRFGQTEVEFLEDKGYMKAYEGSGVYLEVEADYFWQTATIDELVDPDTGCYLASGGEVHYTHI